MTCLGSVQPCSLYSISIGNIYHTSIKEIWNKSMFNKITTYTLKDSKNCSTCTNANYCTQCPGIALSESGKSRNCSEICKKTALARSFVYASIP
ncbi:SPASM domain-containing protein [Streptococcus sp. SG1]|uniref:SPASM domain-containing protein n=1 Tax=Streptococcus TaxID=1301 RepID=UPI001E3D6329|nr:MULTISPECIES: SPASM domain-containing protein [Streptococcus]MDN5018010.1 SPASM domain-containing protein [Streptococcus sp. SG1]MDN5020957.1 SPASM domain-containing protein [Streptococcus sp. SG2]MDU3102359.1 SPASM domain-containing protein [Streptococcus sp.]